MKLNYQIMKRNYQKKCTTLLNNGNKLLKMYTKLLNNETK